MYWYTYNQESHEANSSKVKNLARQIDSQQNQSSVMGGLHTFLNYRRRDK